MAKTSASVGTVNMNEISILNDLYDYHLFVWEVHMGSTYGSNASTAKYTLDIRILHHVC